MFRVDRLTTSTWALNVAWCPLFPLVLSTTLILVRQAVHLFSRGQSRRNSLLTQRFRSLKRARLWTRGNDVCVFVYCAVVLWLSHTHIRVRSCTNIEVHNFHDSTIAIITHSVDEHDLISCCGICCILCNIYSKFPACLGRHSKGQLICMEIESVMCKV